MNGLWTNEEVNLLLDYMQQGLNSNQIAQKLGKSQKAVHNKIARMRENKELKGAQKQEKKIDIHEQALKLLQRERSIEELCASLDLTPRMLEATIEDLKEQGYVFEENGDSLRICKEYGIENDKHIEPWNGEKIIRRAVIGDTHLCSKAQQLTHLNKFYDIVAAEGITEVLHAGDILDGDDVYPGHKFEVFKIGFDDQKQYVIDNYPKRDGIVTKFITGNHDLKWFNKNGCDVGLAIAKERKDLIYLGQYYNDVQLTDNCILRLEHPLGKPAYAVSYKTQRKIDNMRGGSKPNILVEGHYHYSDYMFRRNVHALCVPSFQGPTKFSNRLGLENENGGYLLEIHVDEEGTISRLKMEFIPFYKVVHDDY